MRYAQILWRKNINQEIKFFPGQRVKIVDNQQHAVVEGVYFTRDFVRYDIYFRNNGQRVLETVHDTEIELCEDNIETEQDLGTLLEGLDL